MTLTLLADARCRRLAIMALLLVGFSRVSLAAPFGLCELGRPSCWYPGATWSCWESAQWSQPLDLDGDGVSDFDFAYRLGMWRCGWTNWPDFERLDFDTYAIFPEAHVEVLYLRQSVLKLSPVLEAGFPILPDPGAVAPPRQAGAWSPPEIQPYLRAFGLGQTDNYAGCHPEDYTENCRSGWLLYRGWAVPRGGPWTTNFLCGIRVGRADGSHLGWIR